jgi:hypothetical protein
MGSKKGRCRWGYNCFQCGGEDCIANDYDLRMMLRAENEKKEQEKHECKRARGIAPEQIEEKKRQIAGFRKRGYEFPFISNVVGMPQREVENLYGDYVMQTNSNVEFWNRIAQACLDNGTNKKNIRPMIRGLAMQDIFCEEDLYTVVSQNKSIRNCGAATVRALNTFIGHKLKTSVNIGNANIQFIEVDGRRGRKIPKRRKKNAG